MESVPRGTHAYAVLFSIGMLTNNLDLGICGVEGALTSADRAFVRHGRQAFLMIGAGRVHRDRRALRALHAGRKTSTIPAYISHFLPYRHIDEVISRNVTAQAKSTDLSKLVDDYLETCAAAPCPMAVTA
jgi:hypothetical protein